MIVKLKPGTKIYATHSNGICIILDDTQYFEKKSIGNEKYLFFPVGNALSGCGFTEDLFHIFKIGDKVKLPFNETGIIKKINTETLDWHPYKIKIQKATFNKTNEIREFKYEQLEII